MGEYVQTASGAILKDTHILESGDFLFVYVQDSEATIKSVCDALYGNSGELTIHRYGQDRTVAGFSRLTAVRSEPGIQISAVLEKE